MSPCPDFDLAELEGFDSRVLLNGENSADAFVVALAVAFNDLKDENWFRQRLEECKPKEPKIEPESGQWWGMAIHFTRHVAGILHELMEAIRAARSAGVLDEPTFVKALERCS